ncbi:MAG: CbtA family protein [Alphaproteobacteria bacterium]|nr:CbtA family protein [Alphaproteobacteria bacterium]
MVRRVFFAALAAGLLAGLLLALLQEVTTTPLILQAELYENATANTAPRTQDATVAPAAADGHHDGEAWAPEDGLERSFFSALTNLLSGVGFALLLIAGFVLRGAPVDAMRGVLWGLGGFAAFTLSPALGLAPEVPGAAAAELASRQVWWLATVVGTGVGLWLLAFGRSAVWRLAAIAVLVLPHVVGAPHAPAGEAGLVPPELAAHFAAASIVIQGVFWAALGWLSATFYARFGVAEADAVSQAA